VTPDETLRGLRGRLDQFGITRLADITGLDRPGIPVAAAYRPAARSLAVSMGKGVTKAAAQASALMESIELWHAERPMLPIVFGCARDLQSAHRLADWTGLARPAGTEFTATTPTAWVGTESLVDGSAALLPFEAVHTDGRIPEPPGSGWFICTSNGLASGNTIEEAQLHAVCELIERDAVTLWRLAGDPFATAIAVQSISSPVARSLLERFQEAGLALILHDVTSDIGVATVQCTVFEPDADDSDLAVHATSGMGCHPSRTVALCRAMTEAAQSRLALISGARDDMFRGHYRPGPAAREQARWLREQWRASELASRAHTDLPELATCTLEADLDAVLGALTARGFTPWWVDLGRPDVGIAVGRAVVPGLEQLTDVSGYEPGARARTLLMGHAP
jgi:ribosomal protein S12 methylthiotransferase accessory factor